MSEYTPSTEVADNLARYQPTRLSADQWASVAAEAMDLVLSIEPASWQVAKSHVSALAALLAHVCGSGPVSLEVLTHEVVEGYVTVLRAEKPEGNSVSTTRGRLRRLVERRTPSRLSDAGRTNHEWRPLDPYSDEEMRAISACADQMAPELAAVLRRGVVLIGESGLGPRETSSVRVEGSRLVCGADGRDVGPAPACLGEDRDVAFDGADWATVRTAFAEAVGWPLRRTRLRDRWVARTLSSSRPLADLLSDFPLSVVDLGSAARSLPSDSSAISDVVRRL